MAASQCRDRQSCDAQRCVFHFSSRTDSGVHALANSATVQLKYRRSKQGVLAPIPSHVILKGVNYQLRKSGHGCRITNVRVQDVPLYVQQYLNVHQWTACSASPAVNIHWCILGIGVFEKVSSFSAASPYTEVVVVHFLYFLTD
jgi:hypothetical protein